jgi:hypothetical protein
MALECINVAIPLNNALTYGKVRQMIKKVTNSLWKSA